MTKTITENKEILVAEELITNQIYNIRGQKVMLDSDLAQLYGVENRVLKQAVKRKETRFPPDFMFKLTKDEWEEVITACDNLSPNLKFSPVTPLVFTELGVSMISSILNSEQAISINILIIRAFTKLRQILSDNSLINHRLDNVERKQIESDLKFERVFNALESKKLDPDKGVFFDGEIFDAYVFIADIIKKANHSIVLIDNYVDESILNLFTKRKEGVEFTIYTHNFTKQLKLDVEKHNAQYPPVIIKTLKLSHDRFLILDDKIVYHIGASLKDLGKKWFAFQKIDDQALNLLDRLRKL